MWFGTFDGLNRFDGYNFKVFRNSFSDSTSLRHNYINAIGEDHHNNIWIGTGQGLSIYNNVGAGFLPGQFYPPGSKIKERIPYNVNEIKTDKQGNVFIATNGGGLLVQEEGADAAVQLPCTPDAKGACMNDARSVLIDNQQRVWVLMLNLGLCRYDPAGKKLILVNSEVRDPNCLEADDSNNIWVGAFDGLYKYEIASNKITRYYKGGKGALSANMVVSLFFDRNKELWIGTEGGGVDILHTATGQFSYILPGDGENNLSSESVFAIYEDNESRKWLGTLKGGINIIDPQKNKFKTIAHDPFKPNSLVNNFVSSFYEDQNQNLWIGTDGGGLSIWNREKSSFTNFQHQPGNQTSLSHNSVPNIQEDYLGNIWVATFGGGINKYNPSSRSFEHYRCINKATGEENIYAWLVYEDREKTLWASTYANGRLYRFNRKANQFEVFGTEAVDVYALAEDHKGNLWAGTAFGIFKVDKPNQTFTRFTIDKPVRSIYEDRSGRIWVGTEGRGLLRFDPVKGNIVEGYTTAEGLCNNSVLNILEDSKGNLWLSTFNGLSKFNPADKTFTNYYREDGLQSNQFIFNSAIQLRSGEMVFGGIKGFNIVNPTALKARNYSPPILVTGLRINNIDVSADSKYVTAINDDQIEKLRIPFDEAVLSLDFSALEYSAPGKISYAYFLEGWDKGWNYSGKLKTASYTKLSEGTYTLRIKATNAEGIWNSREVRMKIVVLPPWYRSWWAYALYILMAAGTVILYQQYRVKQQKMAYEIRIAKLNAAKDRAERETERVINDKEKEINEKRLTFFTNISHEFRTPLTLVINPLKEILGKKGEENSPEAKELNIVYRNARRLLSLVDQLLMFRKTDTGADQLKISRLNFSTLCKNVYLAFVSQARAQDIEYTFECVNENLEIYADRDKMEVILYNLISNALKYTPQGGRVKMQVTETGETAELLVEDNGYGIPPEVGDKLFDRFYQVKEKGVPSRPGFGIGLYLVKHFVESHKGQISYTSKSNQGSRFVVLLRKGKEHFGDHPVYEEAADETSLASELIVAETEPGEKITAKPDKGRLGNLISEKPTLLLVDDDEQMRSYLSKIFSEKFTVYEAENGEEGVHLAYQYRPDIIISDVKMPGMSGIDFCRTVKEEPSLSHIPVILVTAESSLEKKLEGVEGGADDYITKPFEKELLEGKVTNLLKSRSNLQHYFYNEITLQENPLKISEDYKLFLEKCMAVVEKYLDDETFNVKTLAGELNMSHSNLYKKVKSVSGQSVNGFIRFIRLRKAAEILINTNSNVNETAAQVGFPTPKYFREQFAKLFGMNPSEYSKKYRKAFGKNFKLSQEGFKQEES
jgi:signal transduction histidine kinase/ligand-binding sensor domain-containing protein/DNA-binding response OmpR family regulator